VGLVKAPVFALIIGVIGCHAGMQVAGNAESLGQQDLALGGGRDLRGHRGRRAVLDLLSEIGV
jgi:hypothetical protein